MTHAASARGTAYLEHSVTENEDDNKNVPRHSTSPGRDKKLEKIRAIVFEALVAH